MHIIEHHDFIEELSEFLLNIFHDLKTTYTFVSPLPEERAVFLPETLLPLFLYDKQKYINRFCADNFSKATVFNLQFHSVPRVESAMQLRITVQHNLLYEEEYQLLFKFIVTMITTEVRAIAGEENHVDIEPLYTVCIEKFLSAFNALV